MKCLDRNFGSYDSKTNLYELNHFKIIEDIYIQEKQMINDDMLSDLIKVFNFDKYINNGDINFKDINKTTYSDVFKSIIGAVILDSNYDLESIEKVFSSLYYLDGEFNND